MSVLGTGSPTAKLDVEDRTNDNGVMLVIEVSR